MLQSGPWLGFVQHPTFQQGLDPGAVGRKWEERPPAPLGSLQLPGSVREKPSDWVAGMLGGTGQWSGTESGRIKQKKRP